MDVIDSFTCKKEAGVDEQTCSDYTVFSNAVHLMPEQVQLRAKLFGMEPNCLFVNVYVVTRSSIFKKFNVYGH